MSHKKFFFFGFGQVAKHFIQKIISQSKNIEFDTTSRKDTHLDSFAGIKYKSFQFNEIKFDDNIINKVKEANYILISIPPVNGKDLVANFFENFFENKNCKWITYLSATSVYGDHNGEWVDEKSFTKPTSPNGVNRLIAENAWKNLSNKKIFPLQIFRLAGIYSNESNILKRLKLGNVQVVDKKNHFFSRIHLEDIASILYKSLDNFKNQEIYNICDDKPASQNEVAAFGAKLLKLEQPTPIKINEVDSEMLKNFYKDSKKVDNKKMKKFFKYKLKYPTYKEGLNYIFDNNT